MQDHQEPGSGGVTGREYLTFTLGDEESVSYTHLTLPTNREV